MRKYPGALTLSCVMFLEEPILQTIPPMLWDTSAHSCYVNVSIPF